MTQNKKSIIKRFFGLLEVVGLLLLVAFFVFMLRNLLSDGDQKLKVMNRDAQALVSHFANHKQLHIKSNMFWANCRYGIDSGDELAPDLAKVRQLAHSQGWRSQDDTTASAAGLVAKGWCKDGVLLEIEANEQTQQIMLNQIYMKRNGCHARHKEEK